MREPLAENEWHGQLLRMEEYGRVIASWPPAAPDPTALRCAHSRHRTLAHLRACQETWLTASLAFHERDHPKLKLLHPWRRFDQDSYATISWDDHLAAFEADRQRWQTLLAESDRTRTGTLNGTVHSIESLLLRLLDHEHHHLFTPR